MASNSQVYICSEVGCLTKFSRKSRLIIHMRTHSGERPYVCSHDGCDKSYARSQHLTRHIKKMHDKKSDGCLVIDCDESKKNDAEDHSAKVTSYECSYCKKTFTKKRYKNEHEKTHIMDTPRPYSCPREGCDSKFPTPDKLKRHVKTHDGHKCQLCDAGGFTWSLLRKHKAIDHMKERQCTVCNRVFSKVYNLKKHMKFHQDPSERHRCVVGTCPRAYTEEKNLRYHVQRYHATRPFQCDKPDCGKAFKEEAELLKHGRYHDPNIPLPSKKQKKKKRPYSYAAYLAGCIEPVQKDRKKKTEERNNAADSVVSKGEDKISIRNEASTSASSSNCDECSADDNTKNAPAINAATLSKLIASTSEKSNSTIPNHYQRNYQLFREICH